MVLKTPQHPSQPLTLLDNSQCGHGPTLQQGDPRHPKRHPAASDYPAIDKDGAVATPPTPAVIQHAVSLPVAPNPSGKPPRPHTALIPVPPTGSLRRDGQERTRTSFYKPHVRHPRCLGGHMHHHGPGKPTTSTLSHR
jgi:hypothetical protein